MPFTPLHLGPGAIFKGIGGDRFSFMVFGGSQVLMDIEPAYRMIVQDSIIHGPTHTLAGAAIIGSIATLSGKPISEFVLRYIRYPKPTMSWLTAATGAFIGTFSHVFFDAIMHADMMPWAPLSDSNELLGLVSIDSLHMMLVILGVIGAVLFFAGSRDK
jgi:membrane-bound metal-dependent hydrolase YbcI (DUF457 family)